MLSTDEVGRWRCPISGLLTAVCDHALVEAEEYEREALALEGKAAAKRRLAEGLRTIHGIAAQYAKPPLQLVKESAS
jgi:hypothetical protein